MQSTRTISGNRTYETDGSVRIYRLMDPASFTENSPLLKTIVVPDEYKNDKVVFNITSSGFFSWFNLDKFDQAGSTGDLPKTIEEVMSVITNYLTVDCLSRYNTSEKIFHYPFPPLNYLKSPPSVVGVTDATSGGLDHLLCRYYARLYTNGQNETTDVDGAIFEFRIGKGKKVIGLNVRWLPIISVMEETGLFLPPAPDDKDTADGSDQASKAQLVYLLEYTYQPFLTPYYKTMDEENAHYTAACKFSLDIAIVQKPASDGVTLTAFVNGGSGDFVYSWAYWQPDTVTTEGVTQLNEDSDSITLGLGVYNVILDVLDRRNGRPGAPQRKRFEQTIYSLGLPDDDQT